MFERRYPAIIADPPWQYDSPRALVGNGGRGAEGAAEIIQADVSDHYGTMSIEELRALSIPATQNSVIFMWTTNPFLCDGTASALVKAWGFTPKTVLTWAKTKAGEHTPSMKTGHWFRSASEHVIFAVKGAVKRPTGFPAIATWFPHVRLPHSVKPERVHEFAEAVCPDGPWLEMFARRARRGWDTWGNGIAAKSDDLFG